MTATVTVFPEIPPIRSRLAVLFLPLLLLAGCGEPPWNNPHPPAPPDLLTYQSMMSPSPPKHLDPAVSYASDEALYIMQIYEPPMAYHFLKRPYELMPGALEAFPALAYLDAEGNAVSADDASLAYTRYTTGRCRISRRPVIARCRPMTTPTRSSGSGILSMAPRCWVSWPSTLSA
jgi:hypothetical protein